MSKFVLIAGGTGGHLFPAMALAQELRRRGHEIYLMSDGRVGEYGKRFPAKEIIVIPSATPSISNPIKFIKAGFIIVGGIFLALKKLKQIKPDVVIGFGGYPVFPPFLAASLLRIPGVLHEQNAVLGRANRALARFAKELALSFEITSFADKIAIAQTVTGNPIRDSVRQVANEIAYSKLRDKDKIRLLVFGGSQGARVFSDIVPLAIANLPKDMRKRLDIVQQCREEDLERVANAYRGAKVNVELATFFNDLPERMAQSHLVICRSGASSVAELTALGIPSILIPLPGSLDGDQANNAAFLEASEGGWLLEQATLSPQSLAKSLKELFEQPELLDEAAQKAKSLGQPKAVEKLANLAQKYVKVSK